MRELAMRQAGQGDHVVLYSAEQKSGSLSFHGAEVRAIQCKQAGTLRAAEFMWKSLRDARHFRPDVIHFHSLPEGAAFQHWFGASLNVKTVLSFDFYEFRRGRRNPFFPWYQRALRQFSALLPVSKFCRRESSGYWRIPENDMRVLYNGVSLQQFHPDTEGARLRRAALGLTDEFVLLYVGRVCHQKGTDLLVDAYAQLRAEGHHVRLVIAGPIGQFGTAGSSAFTDRLTQLGGLYLGAVDEQTLPTVYAMADAFVMPTRMAEMFGMAAIEAQACGVPVVCSDHGGLPEVITPDSGLLFRNDDLADLIAKLRNLMADRALQQRTSTAAVPNAERFAWERIASDLNEIYQ
jgi:glycosyltransferase involved in cell wall biosynthesis